MAPKVYVIIYSLYGHIATMAKSVVEGLEAGGCEVVLCRAPELLSDEIREKMHAPPQDESIPICNVKDLPEADGFIFGIATRFGMSNAQMKSLWDSTGSLWQAGALAGKPAGIFVSTGTQGGGQETTALTWVTQLTHHGMIFVPLGYTTPLLFNMDEVHGGSPYGAGTFAGPDGSRQPTQLEKDVAKHQGTYFAGVVTALKNGKA
ncbi:flagellar associated protein [Tribonema minus]|uniref:Flagellar associated protein n=1 Tax=Tribonema minus TaxID=303371 RepID=A0A835YJD4_9STRA|nr:flagellar associated protein [Tribonema minus]|eukprot:TRINITY_DN594_c1_g1_i1.p1 TRINITY_DN594_c1_g1~~TRINITY_DN594_c1_g1_i1.p1  ORF type:complete len:205 (+),score=76.11 TRINITY_DN594_c1_g1_i1:103-717(+)